MTARGVNRIVVLSPTLQEVRRVAYTSERPLFCERNRLHVSGDLGVDDATGEGNVLVFSAGGRSGRIERADVTELPIYGDER